MCAANDARRLIPEILERERHGEIPATQEGDDLLQLVALLARHANLPLLQRALHLERLLFDRLDNFLRLVALEALLDQEILRGVAERRNRRILPLHVAEVDIPLR